MTEVLGGKMAFPIHNTGHGAPFDEGMSLRDYIAIQAMMGQLAGESPAGLYGVVRFSYKIADAMLEYRVSGDNE
jgi:hypothetical protein